MKLVAIIVSLVVSNVCFASCERTDEIARFISFKLKQDAFIESVRNVYGDRVIDLGFYSDILADMSSQSVHDERIEKHFSEKLTKAFSCAEITTLAEFIESEIGVKFFSYYLDTLNTGGAISTGMGMEYIDSFKQRAQERNEFILNLLSKQPDQYAIETVEVIVAKSNLSPGAQLSKENLAIHKLPKRYIGSLFVTPRDADSLSGKALKRELSSGDLVLHDFVQ